MHSTRVSPTDFHQLRAMRLTKVNVEDVSVWLQLTVTAPTAGCPEGATRGGTRGIAPHLAAMRSVL